MPLALQCLTWQSDYHVGSYALVMFKFTLSIIRFKPCVFNDPSAEAVMGSTEPHLLCFLFLHCNGSQSVGPEPIVSASAGNFFESEGMGSSHLCMYKSPKRFSGTQKFQNHYFIWNQHSSLTQAPTASVFIFSSFPSFPLSPTPHALKGFPDFVTPPRCHWLDPFPSSLFPAITTLIQAHISFWLLQ